VARHAVRDSRGRFTKSTPGSTSKVAGSKVRVNPATGDKKVHAGRYVHDEAYDEDQHDCGPWIEVNSTRVEAIRYDYQNRAVHVRWSRSNTPYIYLDVPYERFRSFIRASSKGKYINSAMNSYEYRQMTPDEIDAPSNDRRSRIGA
jgi:hypothetical protein